MSQNLLENILSNAKSSIGFDFSKSIKENNQNFMSYDHDSRLPVQVEESINSWEHVFEDGIEKLVKCYYFKTQSHMMYFLNECMQKIHSLKKIPILSIDDNTITVFLYTQDINQVTEYDIELSRYLDEINQDITFIEDL